MEVGASGPKVNSEIFPWFSNYSNTIVDILAPGVDIYSTFPGNRYKYLNGTSMAAPVVSGAVACILGYNSKRTALDLKRMLMESALKVEQKVNVGGEVRNFKELSISGGILNILKALNNDLK